jgi:hypothetical protein
MVKDTGELGTYVYATGTFTSLMTTGYFWYACFTTSSQKAVALSWLPNADLEFITHQTPWSAGDATKDWHLWYLDWGSGTLMGGAWGCDPKDGGAKAIKFFIQNGNPYLLFGTQNTAHIRRYVENS